MKILNIKPYINFSSNSGGSPKRDNIDNKKEKREKFIKYTIAATAAAAIVIGGLYYIGRRGGSKNFKRTSDYISSVTEHGKPKDTPNTNANKTPDCKLENDSQKTQEAIIENSSDNLEPEKPKTRIKRKNKHKNKNVDTDNIPDSKKPFVLDKKYFDFQNIEGKIEDNVVTQIENGLIKRQFASYDGKHLNFYSEFDSSGKRIIDVEFRNNGTVKSIKKYKNEQFSEMFFYDQDGVTLVKNYTNEEEADFFNLNFS